jgi:RNA polymerase sigma-70 factor (ECF subfamily)
MEVDTAQAIIRTQCDAHDAAEPLRRCLQSEAQALLRTIRMYIAKAGVADGGDIETAALEVLSRVAIEALKSPGKFDSGRPPKAWLLGIATNIIKRMQREYGKVHAHEVPASQLAGGAADDEGEDEGDFFERVAALSTRTPEGVVLIREGADELLNLVGADDRRVLELAVLGDLDGAQLGRGLGISPGAARVRLSRAMSRLRAAYHEREARHGQA